MVTDSILSKTCVIPPIPKLKKQSITCDISSNVFLDVQTVKLMLKLICDVRTKNKKNI